MTTAEERMTMKLEEIMKKLGRMAVLKNSFDHEDDDCSVEDLGFEDVQEYSSLFREIVPVLLPIVRMMVEAGVIVVSTNAGSKDYAEYETASVIENGQIFIDGGNEVKP